MRTDDMQGRGKLRYLHNLRFVFAVMVIITAASQTCVGNDWVLGPDDPAIDIYVLGAP